MTILSNSRQELFCQALASGKSDLKAHLAAGYNGNAANAHALKKKPHISQRINELLEQKEKVLELSTSRAIKETKITKIWVLSMLRENLERAMQHVPAKDAAGQILGIYQYNGAVANKAAELIGREIGMFIERHEHGQAGDFDKLSDKDLLLHISQTAQLLIENQTDSQAEE